MENELWLWLDDVRPAPHGWTWAKSVDEAISLVMIAEFGDVPWTRASLDHDMGMVDFDCETCGNVGWGYPPEHPDHCPDCKHVIVAHKTYAPSGHDFILWMAANRKWPEMPPSLHTANPVGMVAMRKTIERDGPYDD
jgi:hypothetical protein